MYVKKSGIWQLSVTINDSGLPRQIGPTCSLEGAAQVGRKGAKVSPHYLFGIFIIDRVHSSVFLSFDNGVGWTERSRSVLWFVFLLVQIDKLVNHRFKTQNFMSPSLYIYHFITVNSVSRGLICQSALFLNFPKSL